MINKVLSDIGLASKEVEVYISLLESGQSKAIDVSKKTGLNRTTVYDLLHQLVIRGLVSQFNKDKSTFFQVSDPNLLLSYLDREEKEIKQKIARQRDAVRDALPELLSKQPIMASKPKVQMFEGKKGMREAYEDTLTARNGILAYANVKTMHEGLPNFFPTYYQRRVDAKVDIKAILPYNPESVERAQNDRAELRLSKFMPGGDNFSPEINIYNNKVLITSWKEQISVIIESKEFADFHHLMFERLWEAL